ncbi:MAG: hypothetical protein AAF438_08155 [Pseudomonadota bacterium]
MLRRSLLVLGTSAALSLGLGLTHPNLAHPEPIVLAQSDAPKSRRQGRKHRSVDGKQRSKQTRHKRTENGRESRTEWTGHNGRKATRDVTVTNDRELGQRTKDVTYTGPGGKQRTANHQTNKTQNGYTRGSVFTDAQGRQATKDVVVNNDKENGIRTKDVTFVGRDGQTRTANHTTTQTETGFERNSVLTDANGNQATRDAIVSRDTENGVRTRDVDYVGRDGQTRTVNDTTSRTEDGYERNTVLTRGNGDQVTRDVDAYWDAESGTWVKDIDVTKD